MYLGDYIQIENQTSQYTFSCSCVSTDTSFTAIVDEDKRDIFDNTEFLSDKPHACRFLRPKKDGRIVCTIHETSPAQCKIYRCVLMRIFSPDNEQIGYITGTGALHSVDPTLREVYESGMREVPESVPDTEEWLAGYIRSHGYLVQ